MTTKNHRIQVTVNEQTADHLDTLKRYLLSIGVDTSDSATFRFAAAVATKHITQDAS